MPTRVDESRFERASTATQDLRPGDATSPGKWRQAIVAVLFGDGVVIRRKGCSLQQFHQQGQDGLPGLQRQGRPLWQVGRSVEQVRLTTGSCEFALAHGFLREGTMRRR